MVQKKNESSQKDRRLQKTPPKKIPAFGRFWNAIHQLATNCWILSFCQTPVFSATWQFLQSFFLAKQTTQSVQMRNDKKSPQELKAS